VPANIRAGSPAVRPNPGQVRRHLGLPPASGRRATALAAHQGQWQQHAATVRNNLQGRYNNLFTPQWYAQHPNAWHLAHPHADMWAAVGWGALARWVGYGAGYAPYDYGTVYEDVTYYITDDGTMAVEGDVADVTDLATTEATAEPEADEWLPLGVFAVTSVNSKATPNRVMQFAVSHGGLIGGSYYDALTGQTVPIQGSINKDTQRAAWTVGSNKQTIWETNLASFTEDQPTVLVHHGKDQTEQWMMVRLQNTPSGQTNPTNTSNQNQPTGSGMK
jgi:hypothetical protein